MQIHSENFTGGLLPFHLGAAREPGQYICLQISLSILSGFRKKISIMLT